MTQITPEHPPEATRDLLQRNIRKTVAVSGLRKMRAAVDDYDEEQRLNHHLSRRVLAAGTTVAALIAVILVFSGGAVPRFITGAINWFKG